MKRLAIILALLATTYSSAAQAEKFFSPVYIKNTTLVCRHLSTLKIHAALVKQQRTESANGMLGPMGLSGECKTARAGQWMFFDGFNSNAYLCLRPRRGADCYWVRREDVGEIFEMYPGKALTDRTPVACASWASAIRKSSANEQQIKSKFRAYSNANPTDSGQEFVRNMIIGTLGLNVPRKSDVDHANICVMVYATAQEKARRLHAYDWCPSLDAGGKRQADRTSYDGDLRYLAEFCANAYSVQ